MMKHIGRPTSTKVKLFVAFASFVIWIGFWIAGYWIYTSDGFQRVYFDIGVLFLVLMIVCLTRVVVDSIENKRRQK